MINLDNTKFEYYLTGIFEGSDNIYINKYNINILFNLYDLPLVLKIQDNLGEGKITRERGKNAYKLTINRKKMIDILNGKIRTSKYDILIDLNKTPLESTSWLAGYIEANGKFIIRVDNHSENIECRLELKILKDISNISLIKDISNLLKTSISENNKYYIIRTKNIESNSILESYLTKYPLFSKKYLDYKDWLNVFNAIKNQESIENKKYIANIMRARMNENRKIFNWDHLKYLY